MYSVVPSAPPKQQLATFSGTGIGALTNRMRQSAHSGPDDVREAVIEHEAILRALRAGDTATAMAAIAAHIDNVRDRSIASIR
ncbi:FCD domain-containing protein [Brevibacterium sp. 91QC2O2]|nr:FCD domain-containing protein [Brevibacterium sp. 91QC2O2]MCQ9367107.1 FCD domain-containing protein [Brevibacterium sp. 91QC2O2]